MPMPESAPAQQTSPIAFGEDLSHLVKKAEIGGLIQDKKFLPVAPNHGFLKMHWRGNYELETEGLEYPEVLPEVIDHYLVPGVDLCRTRRPGEPVAAGFDMSQLQNSRQGAMYIPAETVVHVPATKVGDTVIPAVTYDGYLRSMDCKSKTGTEGVYYFDPFERPSMPMPGKEYQRKFDRGAFNRWRLQLVKMGVLPPAPPAIVEEFRAKIEKHYRRVESDIRLPDPVRERRLLAYQNRMDAISAVASGDRGEAKRLLELKVVDAPMLTEVDEERITRLLSAGIPAVDVPKLLRDIPPEWVAEVVAKSAPAPEKPKKGGKPDGKEST